MIAFSLPARAEPPADLAPLRWLIGDWAAVGGSNAASGGFSFARSVQDQIIVGTNHSIGREA